MTGTDYYNFLMLIKKLSPIQLHFAAQTCLYYYPDKFEDSFLRDLVWSTVMNNNNKENLIYQINEIAKKSDEELAAEEYKKIKRIDPSGKSNLTYLLFLDKETVCRIIKRSGAKNFFFQKSNSFKETIKNLFQITQDPELEKIHKELNPPPDTAEAWEFVTPNTQ